MESKYYTQEINGGKKHIYTNEFYNLSIEFYNLSIGIDGNVNLDRKTDDSNAIIKQLIEDLSRTNIKMDTMLNAIENGASHGFISAEYAQQLSEYVYAPENNKSRNK